MRSSRKLQEGLGACEPPIFHASDAPLMPTVMNSNRPGPLRTCSIAPRNLREMGGGISQGNCEKKIGRYGRKYTSGIPTGYSRLEWDSGESTLSNWKCSRGRKLAEKDPFSEGFTDPFDEEVLHGGSAGLRRFPSLENFLRTSGLIDGPLPTLPLPSGGFWGRYPNGTLCLPTLDHHLYRETTLSVYSLHYNLLPAQEGSTN